MDPDACLARIMAAMHDGDEPEFYAAFRDLGNWLASGGVPPTSIDMGTTHQRIDGDRYRTVPRKSLQCDDGKGYIAVIQCCDPNRPAGTWEFVRYAWSTGDILSSHVFKPPNHEEPPTPDLSDTPTTQVKPEDDAPF